MTINIPSSGRTWSETFHKDDECHLSVDFKALSAETIFYLLVNGWKQSVGDAASGAKTALTETDKDGNVLSEPTDAEVAAHKRALSIKRHEALLAGNPPNLNRGISEEHAVARELAEAYLLNVEWADNAEMQKSFRASKTRDKHRQLDKVIADNPVFLTNAAEEIERRKKAVTGLGEIKINFG